MGRMKGTGAWSGKGVRYAIAVLATVLALPGCAQAGGDGGDGDSPGKAESSASASTEPKPSESYAAPEDWTEPERWAALPRGKRTDKHGS